MARSKYDELISNASSASKELVPLDDNDRENLPTHIPIRKLADASVQLVPLEEFESQHQIRFTTTIWLPHCVREYHDTYPLNIKRENFHSHLFDLFELLDMGKPYGLALIAKIDIPVETKLFIYEGEYFSLEDYLRRSKWLDRIVVGNAAMYSMKTDASIVSSFDSGGGVDASYYRGISAYAQHLPYLSELDNGDRKRYTILDGVSLASVATVNTSCNDRCYHENLTCNGFFTSEIIPAGTLVGINYGFNYWSERIIQPVLFTKEGSVLPFDVYYPDYIFTTSGVIATEEVFSAILSMKSVRSYYSLTKILEFLIKQFGVARLQDHIKCFLKLHPDLNLSDIPHELIDEIKRVNEILISNQVAESRKQTLQLIPYKEFNISDFIKVQATQQPRFFNSAVSRSTNDSMIEVHEALSMYALNGRNGRYIYSEMTREYYKIINGQKQPLLKDEILEMQEAMSKYENSKHKFKVVGSGC